MQTIRRLEETVYKKKYFWYRPNMLKLRELMSTKNRNIIKKKTQQYILKRLLSLDMVKRMYRHNENDECIIFYFLVFHHLCFSHLSVFSNDIVSLLWCCQYFEMIFVSLNVLWLCHLNPHCISKIICISYVCIFIYVLHITMSWLR